MRAIGVARPGGSESESTQTKHITFSGSLSRCDFTHGLCVRRRFPGKEVSRLYLVSHHIFGHVFTTLGTIRAKAEFPCASCRNAAHDMLLIFPSIEISGGRCIQSVQGKSGTDHLYPDDPIKTAVLWRGENAKTLHVIDIDGVREGKTVNRDIIASMVKAVDIPVQVAGGLQDYDEICDLIGLGAYRVVIGTAAVENPALVERVIRKFGARKVVISIETYNGFIRTRRGKSPVTITPVQHALALKRLGVCRVIYATIDESTGSKILDHDALRHLASGADIRVTAQGGVNSYADLLQLQKLEKIGVDSVIIGKSLYQNRFPCQELWRLNERGLSDLGPTRRI